MNTLTVSKNLLSSHDDGQSMLPCRKPGGVNLQQRRLLPRPGWPRASRAAARHTAFAANKLVSYYAKLHRMGLAVTVAVAVAFAQSGYNYFQ